MNRERKPGLTSKSLFQRSKSSVSLKRQSSIPKPRGSSLSRQSSLEPRLTNSSQRVSSMGNRNSVLHLATKSTATSATKSRPSTSKLITPSTKLPMRCSNLMGSSQRKSALSSRSSLLYSATRSRSKSPRKIMDERPITNVEWQKDNIPIVKEYLIITNNSHLADLVKPDLTISSFIAITQVMLSPLDPRIELSNSNYVNELPAFLKTIGYPGNCTTSLMKTVNIKRSWPQVLAIWAWLVEKLNFLNSFTPKSMFTSAEEEIIFKSLCKFLKITDDESEKGMQEKEIIINEFKENMVSVMNIQEISIEVLKEALKTDEAEEQIVKDKRQILDKLKLEVWECDNKIKSQRKVIEEKKQKLLKQIDESKSIQEGYKKIIKLKTNSVDNLKNSISAQKYTVSQRKELDTKLSQAKHLLALKEERKKAQLKEYDQIELEYNETIKQIHTELFNINSTNIKISRDYNDIKQLILPEENIEGGKFLQILQDNKKKSINLTEEIKRSTKLIMETNEVEIINVEKQLQEEYKLKKEEADAINSILKDINLKYLSEQSRYDTEIVKLSQCKNEVQQQLTEIKQKTDNILEEEENSQKNLAENIERQNQIQTKANKITDNWATLKNKHYEEIKSTKEFLLDTWKKLNTINLQLDK